MTDPKEKPRSGLRAPKAKKTLGLSVPPALRMPHDALIAHSTPPAEDRVSAPDRVPDSDTVSAPTPVTQDRVSSSPAAPRPVSRVSDPTTLSALSRVRVEKHYSRLLNSVIDGVLKTLSQPAQIVYLHLHRLSYGNGRNWCRIGHPKLAERTGIGETTVRRAVGQLVDRGLVAVAVQEFGGPQKGTTYYIPLPPGTPVGAVTLSGEDTLTAEDTVSAASPMKKIMKESYEMAAAGAAPSIYEIRTIGARLFERHRTDLGFDHARLAELVADALAAQGITPDGKLIEEAIRGMAE